ncbi:hypothetical protein OPT61_g2930 [Boeremia exigua]|uniref:Uncharacterized protein n=1 Tax=Boeremia exigua TaxID=749465 RepID=A0ACC2IJN8_9PLEO|nr:hypothetical protein OPT61_g2930 [Boeremia exigua]
MPTNQHFKHESDGATDRTILVCVFTTVSVFFALMLLAHLLKRLTRKRTEDLEECNYLFSSRETERSYNTFCPSLHEASLHDPEIRRMLRHERVRNDISGVYQISVRRLDEDESSLSSDSSLSSSEGFSEYGQGDADDEESSESDSDSESSDDSDEEDAAMGEEWLSSFRRPVLSKRISVLRGTR